jgi:hypothetical protein
MCNPQLDNADKDGGATTDQQCHKVLDGADSACHVTVDNGIATPTCTPGGTSMGACTDQTACRAGYECTGHQDSMCRRYCCDPTACDSSSFCDVQPIVAHDVLVPVCMPIAPCDLLADTCSQGQQCGIVDQTKGVTSCVDLGEGNEGDQCESQHCAQGLACLGTLGSRKCFQLCDTRSADSCPMGQHCLTNSVTFHASAIGICGQ